MAEEKGKEALRDRSESNRRALAKNAERDAGDMKADMDFYAREEVQLREQMRQLYRKLEKTKEWVDR